MTRTCQLCPKAPRNFRALFCADCKRQRKRFQNSMSKRRAGVQPRPADDFPPRVIELRYIRAVWQRHPAKAIKLWQAWRQEAA